jgi:hypothetical protein
MNALGGRARKRGLTAPDRGPRTFDEAFGEHRLTDEERLAMVWHLAMIRARRLVETLGPKPEPEPWMLEVLR